MSDLSNIKVGNFMISINGVSETTGALNSYYDASDLPNGAEFVTFDVTVKNNGNDAAELGALLAFSLTGDEGAICEYCVSDNVDNLALQPGEATNTKVSYIAPKNTSLHFRFTPDLINGYYMDLPVSFE